MVDFIVGFVNDVCNKNSIYQVVCKIFTLCKMSECLYIYCSFFNGGAPMDTSTSFGEEVCVSSTMFQIKIKQNQRC